MFVVGDAEESGTSIRSRASFHNHIWDLEQHDILVTIYFFRCGLMEKKLFFQPIDIREESARPGPIGSVRHTV